MNRIMLQRRGQVLPIVAVLLGLMTIFAMFLFNIIFFENNGDTALTGALRNAAIAALQQMDVTQARYYVCDGPQLVDSPCGQAGANADAVARRFMCSNLDGAASYFADDVSAVNGQCTPTSVFLNPAGTAPNTSGQSTQDGLDVEVIDTLQGDTTDQGAQVEQYFNGQKLSSYQQCVASDGNPGVQSLVTQQCFDLSTAPAMVILRARLTLTQINAAPRTILRSVVVSAGTNQ